MKLLTYWLHQNNEKNTRWKKSKKSKKNTLSDLLVLLGDLSITCSFGLSLLGLIMVIRRLDNNKSFADIITDIDTSNNVNNF
mmetsp:Transcript_12072/g.20927  ORF Transcript_12072/g.20927 Transcript_12072/m.20927 type:complete len:82 (+) Transcript_12072:1130-1375(+)